MPKENQSDPRSQFVPRFLPWLLGGAMLLVYGCTLNHWVTLLNIYQVAIVSGWTWQPQVYNPLTFLVTLPFHLAPVAHVPAALNFFSAVCAAAALGVLARTVAILPHDRTEMERLRERSDFSFLTGWVAWVPPVVAVIFAGLQLGFWENATNFTNESFELLWFAVILWQLLEYRLDEQEGRLFVAAFLYTAGMAENWALLGFAPVFLMMIIWLRKLDFFNLNFLIRMMLCALAGLLLFLLLPVAAQFSSGHSLTMWATLKLNLKNEWLVLRTLHQGPVRRDLALMALTSLLPAFVMSIRWSASFGDSSRLGATLVNYMMHVVNAVLFGLLTWVMFDPPFSAYQLSKELFAAPALTLYYVTALCIGYYCGYGLLIFGKAPVPTRRNPKPEPALPAILLWLCPVVVACTLAAAGLAAGLLVYKNAPIIRAINGDSLLKYAQFTEQKLPPDRAIILCDTDSQDPKQDLPIRVFLMQAALARDGRAQNYPVVDTHALNETVYQNYLHRKFPQSWPQIVTTNDVFGLSPLRIFRLLNELARSNTLCYLNPSFGIFFEQFYQEPHGLVYKLKPLPAGTLLPPALDPDLIAENESFWTQVLNNSRPAIDLAQHPPNYAKLPGAIGSLMKRLHVTAEPDPNALLAGTIYSRSLNFLGVQVQRAGELNQAAALFTESQGLNSNNVVAGINLDFNKTLRAGSPIVVNLAQSTSDQFGKYHNWPEVLLANGPFDEATFCFENGAYFMEAGLLSQAAVLFNRVNQLVPENLAARLYLARIYNNNHLPDQALAVLHDPLTHPLRFALTEFNSTELNIVAASAYFQKKEDSAAATLLEEEMARHPDDQMLLLVSAQAFNARHLYTNSLHVINHKLERAPDDPVWLYGKGFVSLQVGAYREAITALSRFLELETNNPEALFYRGFAYLKNDQLEAARADLQRLQNVYTNDFYVASGLGEIAWRKHETNEALRNYQIFLAHAPTNTVELPMVRERVAQAAGK